MSTIIIYFINAVMLLALSETTDLSISSKVPKKIVSIAQDFSEPQYYQEQAKLWKEVLKEDETNANAWLNYYRACRFSNMFNGAEEDYSLDDIYLELSTKIKDSYEFHYLTFLNSGFDQDFFHQGR